MPTRNISLTDKLDRAVAQRIESGDYENASEVVRAALRALEREEAAKLDWLRQALKAGEESGYVDYSFADVLKEAGLDVQAEDLAQSEKRPRRNRQLQRANVGRGDGKSVSRPARRRARQTSR